jgi:diguanylate cyclase (GGDEF)-like protein
MGPQRRSQRQSLARVFGLQTVSSSSVPGAEPASGDLLHSHDELTGLPDARSVRQAFGRAVLLALRTGEPLTLALIRVDELVAGPPHAKTGIADHLIATVARRLNPRFRSSDLFARWSDDHFALLLPRTSVVGGVRAVEKALLALEGDTVFTPDGRPFVVGLSAAVVPVVLATPFDETVGRARQLLATTAGQPAGHIRWPDGQIAPFARRLLVVSDRSDCVELAMALVSGPDDEIVHVPEPGAAAERVESLMPRLIVLDLSSRPEAGWDVLRRLRTTSAASGTPIVVVGEADEQVLRAFDLGADEFLTRPLWPAEFHARSERLIRRRSRLATARATRPPQP